MWWLLLSVGSALFFTPALQASLPSVVGTADLLSANGLLKLTRETMLMIGAALGGLLVAQFGGSAAFIINALTFFFAAACVAFVQLPPRPSALQERSGLRVIWNEFLQGLGFLCRHSALIRLHAVALLFATASGMAGPLVVVLTKDRLDLGAQGFGFILSGMSAGALAGAALTSWLGARFSQGRLLGWSMLALGAALLGAASATNLLVALGAFALYGLAGVVGGIAYQTAVQAMTPDVLRGRVLSSLGLTYTLASLAAFVLGGWLNDLTGVQPVFVLAGVLALTAGSAASRLLREC